jgi:NTP pyrophosphatase (non-canonical NTP hydrolase)
MVSGNYRHSIRPEVLAFAAAMESKLKENDWKGGWEDESLDYLLARLHDEMNELVAELHAADDKSACVCEEAVDVGAFAMMLHAKARRP